MDANRSLRDDDRPGRGDGRPTASEVPLVAARMRVPAAPALARERLDALLARLWDRRLGLVVAPAGSGKSTLCAQFAARAGVPVAWYRAESWDSEAAVLLRYLEATLGAALGLAARWSSVEDAASALEAWPGERVLLVVDDLHALRDTAAEAALERLLDYAPAKLCTLLASRVPPAFNLPRRRIEGSLLELGGDDLRFRLWEIERLFRDVYQEARPPEELADLERRTEGWAAGLQLFHLATEGRSAGERRRVLTGLGLRSRLTRDYLTRNVLGQLPDGLRHFLVRSCALGRLNGPLCDALLESEGSAAHLEELERRQVFTSALEDGSYRYHEVLRAHLEQALVDQLGQAGARAHFRRAGELLEADGAEPEALHAYCRAEDWPAAERLLARAGQHLARGPAAWLDELPAAVLQSDPWLGLAGGRRLRAQGRWAEAVTAYRRAESTFAGTEAGQICREERQAVQLWLDGEPSSPGAATPLRGGDWVSLLRAATLQEPGRAAQMAAALGGAGGGLAAGLSWLLAGDLSAASNAFSDAQSLEGDPPLGAALQIAEAAARLLGGWPLGARNAERAGETAERAAAVWLARLARALPALTGESASLATAAETLRFCERHGDAWGAALCSLLAAWGCLVAGGEAAAALGAAADRSAALPAPVLACWARALRGLALARGGDIAAASEAEEAAESAAALTIPGAGAVAAFAAALAADADTMTAQRALDESGLAPLARLRLSEASAAAAPTPSATPVGNGHPVASLCIHCFGGLRVWLHGEAVDLGAAKPRVRTLLRLLAANAGRPVHREVLQEALWPEADADTGLRNLHVAVSALRQLLEPGMARAGFTLVVREGDAYRLALSRGAAVDVVELDAAFAAGRAAAARHDTPSAVAQLRQVLALHDGELLPEEGPAEWLVPLREHCRAQAVEAAATLARLLLGDDCAAAAQACSAGLELDRYDDRLWRLLIEARERAGDRVAASRTRRAYDEVVAELSGTAAPGAARTT